MNITHRCFIVLSIAAICCACEDSATKKGTTYPSWPEQQVYTLDTVDCRDLCCVPANAITIHKAIEIGKKLASGSTTEEEYYIKGLVKSFNTSKHEEGIAKYGNGCWYLQDNTHTNVDFYCFQTMGLKGAGFTSLDQIKVGDFVVVKGKITNYNGTIETESKGKSYVVCSSNDLLYPEKDVVYVDEKFTTGIDHWSRRVVNGSLGIDTWKANTTSQGTTSAQADVTGTQGSFPAGEVWIESPQYNLVKEGATSAKLTFQHAYKFMDPTTESVKDYLRVKVSRDGGVSWDDFAISKFNDGTSKKTTYVSDTIDISNYISDKTQIAFAYKSSATFAPKWNVSYITVFEHKHARDCN